MKLGIFDSGLGGLLIAKSIRDAMPDIDMAYLGDTLHVPYGKRSDDAIYDFTKRSMEFLFDQGCELIIIACNSASATALRCLQQTYLRNRHPDRRILGVVVPTLEYCLESGSKTIGVLGTQSLIASNIYHRELKKFNAEIDIYTKAAPLIVPLIEDGGDAYAYSILKDYIRPLVEQSIDALVLGCTHYPYYKDLIASILDECQDEFLTQAQNETQHDYATQDIPKRSISVISQDDIIPEKLADYLKRHPEIDKKIGREATSQFFVTDVTDHYARAAKKIYGQDIFLRHITLPQHIADAAI